MNSTIINSGGPTKEQLRELYFQSLFIAFKKFIDEEKAGHVYTELRLNKAIEAARTLYKH